MTCRHSTVSILQFVFSFPPLSRLNGTNQSSYLVWKRGKVPFSSEKRVINNQQKPNTCNTEKRRRMNKRNLKQMPSESPSAKSQMQGHRLLVLSTERVSITCSLPLVGLFQYFMLIHYHCNTPSFIFIQEKELWEKIDSLSGDARCYIIVSVSIENRS